MQFVEAYGLWVVFACVLMDQGGLPTPAYPPIILAASVAVENGWALAEILLVATIAAVLADLFWYMCGRRYGATMLRLMCKISLSPDSCVGTTRRVYGRWGASSLVVAKFVPGLAAISTTLAGESRIHLGRFVIYDCIGAALWASGAIALGVVFRDAVGAALATLDRFGGYALLLFALVLVLFIAFKWRNRRQFLAQIQMPRLSPEELELLMRQKSDLTILDMRSAYQRTHVGWIPGSIHVVDIEVLQPRVSSQVVVYCDCPNDASAAVAARRLIEKGFTTARPLAGGFDAWKRGGRELHREEPSNGVIFAQTSESESQPAWYA